MSNKITIERKSGKKTLFVHPIDEKKLIQKANRFLQKYNSSNKIPVDIESIIEFDIGIRIISIPNLYKESGIRSYTNPMLKAIYIDESEFKDEYSARVTITHEFAHTFLHKEIFEDEEFSSPEEYIEFQGMINGKGYRILEAQALFFAPYILLPQKELEEFVFNRISDFGGLDCMVQEHFAVLIEDIKNKFKVSKGCIHQQVIREFPKLYKMMDPYSN